ncbi:MAG: MBL fold metallo-hydrolase [Anaerolineae bacterium]|jgi:glyoxylase-like metal-dependent hydrolase (beta-lactamase superfamily II)|nr:MBL fold metallo-hydrolase [Anaerolineae bacterium]MDX9829208.1 MBL fold metallo-hydrolase [Anaerolineae bacterium]
MEIVPGLHWVERIWDTKVYLLLDGDDAIVVDAAMPGRARAVLQHLESLGRPPSAIKEIWLTHGDIDHMGSTAALQEASGARVVAHEADVPLIEGKADRALGPVLLAAPAQRLFNGAVNHLLRYCPARVERAVRDGDHLGDWQVIHVPGHTAGSACFYHPGRRIAIVGDALNHRRGRLGAPPLTFSVDMAQAYASIRRLADLDIEICCFGHGPPLLAGARQRIRAMADSLPRP